MNSKLLAIVITLFFASCSQNKPVQTSNSLNQVDSLTLLAKAQQKTIDSLMLIYDTLSYAIPSTIYKKSDEDNLLYLMSHHNISKGHGFTDLQLRLNNLEGIIKKDQEIYASLLAWVDTIKEMSHKVSGQTIELYQFTEIHERYYKEITIINYPDSVKAIVRGYICFSPGNYSIAGTDEKRITKAQWKTLQQKTYSAHFDEIEVIEMPKMSQVGLLNIKSALIDDKNKVYHYHEIQVVPENGSVEEMYNYAEKLLEDTQRIFYELPVLPHNNLN